MKIIRPARKAILSLVCAFAFSIPSMAQGDSSRIAAQQSQIDSLKQTIVDLSHRQDESEHQAFLDRVWKRKGYLYLSYVTNQTLTDKDNPANKWKSSTGFALSWGKTFYLHRKPLVGIIKFGLDWSWIDVSYVKYKNPNEDSTDTGSYGDEEPEEDGGLDWGLQQVDMAMRFGPSVTVNPVDYLKVATYFHYIPTASGIILDDNINFGFVNGFSWGLNASYKVISLGFELRWASGKYRKFDSDKIGGNLENGEVSFDDLFSGKPRFKTSSFRLNVGFRF